MPYDKYILKEILMQSVELLLRRVTSLPQLSLVYRLIGNRMALRGSHIKPHTYDCQ